MKKYIKASKQRKKVKASASDDEFIMGILRESFGHDEYDDSHDEEVLEYYNDNNDIFDTVCDYEGLVGYGESIREWIADIYGVDLDNYAY